MTYAVQPIPPGFATVTAYLAVRGAAKAIDFYRSVFGAEETMRLDGPGGTVAHAEIRIGDTLFMLSDENPDWGNASPIALGGSPVHFMIYTEDCDALVAKAVAAGAKELRPLADQFYGDRTGTVIDPFGFQWTIATHVEDVSVEEVKVRMAKMMGG